jgi:RNA polymerase subunit RPABC4/transcription elongation factor Spt4
MGAAALAPYLHLLCRKCKTLTEFQKPHCKNCGEFIWPNEFNLIDHWKDLRQNHSIAVTNVFNKKPPDMCLSCGAEDKITYAGRTQICSVCKSSAIKTNNIGYFFGTSIETEMPPLRVQGTSKGTHLKAEHFPHVKRLWNEITSLQPNLIIALGNVSCWALLEQTKISELRGTIAWSERLKTKVLPTYHPAAILRQPNMRPVTIADLIKASREAEFSEIRRPERWITILDPSEEGIAEGYEWFRRPALAYANDIETHKRQITIIGFARSKDDALVIPFRRETKELSPGLSPNYWPTPELEFKAWKLAIHGLQTIQPKIFQNGVYDISYYLRMGILPKNVAHDTMLWHHALYPELPKSLGFLGSIYSNEIAWKLMRRNADSLKRDE